MTYLLKLSFIIAAFVFLSQPLQAQPGPESKRAIDKIFTEWDNTGVPGAAVGIIQNGEWILKKGYGLANLEYDIPIDEKSVFRIASVSKQFTAACIVLLVEQGKLEFDDTLNQFFTGFPDYAKDITIAQLVNHTSGIRDYLMISYFKGNSDQTHYTDEDIMSWLQRQSELNFEPGSEYLYSNSGYWLLGKIVKKVSGKNMKAFTEQEIFKPLGMFDTHFHNDHAHIVKNRASGYQPDGNNGFRMNMTTLDMIGDGGIYTNLEDLKKWVDDFYNQEVLSQGFWAVMTQKGTLNDGSEIDYASGLNTGLYKGLPLIGHSGSFVGYRAELVHFPEQKTSFIVLANRSDASPSSKNNAMADIILEEYVIVPQANTKETDLTKESEISLTVPLNQIAGFYWNEEDGRNIELKLENDTLRLHMVGSEYPMQLTGPDLFITPDLEAISKIHFSNEGSLNKLEIYFSGYSSPDKYEEYVPAQYDSAGLRSFEGDYYSADLNETYRLSYENSKLYLYLNNKKYAALNPVKEDLFTHEQFGVFKFTRSETNDITGFELSLVRVTNLKFKKK